MPSSLIFLTDYAKSPVEHVGDRARQLGSLHEAGIPVVRSFCITIPMLRSISEANNLKLKLTQVLKRSPCRTKEDQRCFQRELSRLFTSLTIPPAIAAELIRAYHQYLQGGHAHIIPSSPPSKTYPSGQSNVYGDANVIESILEVWANIVATTVQHGGYNLPMHTLLLQSPILVEYAPAAEASGFAYTKNPATGSKTEVAIAGAWGVYHPNLENLDTITVDIRTWNVINRQPATKTQEYVRGNETLKQQSVAAAKQKQLVLSDTEAVQLARVAFKLKQQSLDQQKIYWLLFGRQIYVTGVEPVLEFSNEPHPASLFQPETSPTRRRHTTRLLVSAGNSAKAAEQIQDGLDGIGVLRSEYTIAKMGIHPQQLVRSKKRTELKAALTDTILTYQRALGGKLILYRLQNFTSAELGILQYASSYEPQEPNPYLGYRGALKALTQPQVFNLELEAVAEAVKKDGGPIGCLLPFVRTPAELRALLVAFGRTGLMEKHNFGVWLQLNTPENIFNLDKYPTAQLDGFSINITSLHGLMHGIDPDNIDLWQRYPLQIPLLAEMLEKTIQTVKENSQSNPVLKPQQVYIHLEQYHPDLVAAAVKLGVDGVTVKPQAANLARECIMDTEAQMIGVGKANGKNSLAGDFATAAN